jgi:hypothetical protein
VESNRFVAELMRSDINVYAAARNAGETDGAMGRRNDAFLVESEVTLTVCSALIFL